FTAHGEVSRNRHRQHGIKGPTWGLHRSVDMPPALDRLPDRFPVGTGYVIEGRDGGDGRLRIDLSYLEFPDGPHVDLPVDLPAEPTARARPRRSRATARK